MDAVGIAITEYRMLCREIRFEPIFVSSRSGCPTERYVLLVDSGGFVKSIGDLEGRNICFHKNSRNCLALQWLDTLLVSHGYPTATRLAGRIVRDTKLSQVVLPVFFRKADACVVTRKGFDTMCELNPQLAERLRVLAESREIVPYRFCHASRLQSELQGENSFQFERIAQNTRRPADAPHLPKR